MLLDKNLYANKPNAKAKQNAYLHNIQTAHAQNRMVEAANFREKDSRERREHSAYTLLKIAIGIQAKQHRLPVKLKSELCIRNLRTENKAYSRGIMVLAPEQGPRNKRGDLWTTIKKKGRCKETIGDLGIHNEIVQNVIPVSVKESRHLGFADILKQWDEAKDYQDLIAEISKGERLNRVKKNDRCLPLTEEVLKILNKIH